MKGDNGNSSQFSPKMTRSGKVISQVSPSSLARIHSARVVDGKSREFLWGCTLTKDEPTYTWSCLDEENDVDYLEHTIFIKQACLGLGVKEDERNIVSIESKGYDNSDLKLPLANMRAGATENVMIDLVFQQDTPFTLRLVSGSGPVYISGNHLVEVPEEKASYDTEAETDCPDESMLTNDETLDESMDQGKKRKGPRGGNKKKKGRLESKSATDETEEQDEESTEGSTGGSEESDDQEEQVASRYLQGSNVRIDIVKEKRRNKTVAVKPKPFNITFFKGPVKRVRVVKKQPKSTHCPWRDS